MNNTREVSYISSCESGDAIRLCVPAHHWQPIETAPSEKMVLLYSPNKLRKWTSFYDLGVYQNGAWRFMDSVLSEPTHWMPLPEPPAHSGEPA